MELRNRVFIIFNQRFLVLFSLYDTGYGVVYVPFVDPTEDNCQCSK